MEYLLSSQVDLDTIHVLHGDSDSPVEFPHHYQDLRGILIPIKLFRDTCLSEKQRTMFIRL